MRKTVKPVKRLFLQDFRGLWILGPYTFLYIYIDGNTRTDIFAYFSSLTFNSDLILSYNTSLMYCTCLIYSLYIYMNLQFFVYRYICAHTSRCIYVIWNSWYFQLTMVIISKVFLENPFSWVYWISSKFWLLVKTQASSWIPQNTW